MWPADYYTCSHRGMNPDCTHFIPSDKMHSYRNHHPLRRYAAHSDTKRRAFNQLCRLEVWSARTNEVTLEGNRQIYDLELAFGYHVQFTTAEYRFIFNFTPYTTFLQTEASINTVTANYNRLIPSQNSTWGLPPGTHVSTGWMILYRWDGKDDLPLVSN
jgi:hypothetical protein